MVKDKPYLCMCEKMGLIAKVVKKFEAQYGFNHQNWLTFFVQLFRYPKTRTFTFYYRLPRSAISVNNQVFF